MVNDSELVSLTVIHSATPPRLRARVAGLQLSATPLPPVLLDTGDEVLGTGNHMALEIGDRLNINPGIGVG